MNLKTMDFYETEDTQGYRAIYNVLPSAQTNLTQTITPGIFYTPMKQIENLIQVSYAPVICQKCGAILNSMNQVDYNQKVYTCTFCGMQQKLPSSYQQMTEQRKPAELHYAYRTMEYIISQPNQQKAQRAIIFVVDIQLSQQELDQMKDQLQLAIDLLSDDVQVGLITFGTTVNIHQLKYKYCERKIVFRGLTDYTPEQINQCINGKTDLFVSKLSECRENLVSIIEDIHTDLWTIEQKTRGFRATGCAIAIATSLAAVAQTPIAQHRNDAINITVLTGGPCTAGPGKIVDTQLVQYVRCWQDIQENSSAAKHVKDSMKFYDTIAERAQQANSSINVFSCSTDQIGLFEMNEICKKTAGQMMISETFEYISFQKSWRIYLDSLSNKQQQSPIHMGGAVQLTVHTSRNWTIQQMYCQGQSVQQKQQKEPSQHQLFTFSQIDSDFTPLFTFNLSDQANATSAPRFIQFCTEYTDYKTGNRILRVSTQGFQTATNKQQITQYFDQEAAACSVARITSFKFLSNYLQEEAIKLVDRIVIKAARDFVIGLPQNSQQVKFQPEFEFFPQFLYHFRRSEFLNLFGQSPDQTVMKHYQLQRQTVSNMLSMIQPALIAYSCTNLEGEPVLLDASECKSDRVLLFDSFFNLLVWTGKSVVQWREAKLYEKPEYANVKMLLEAPKPECEDILNSRFPTPRYDWSDQGTSQARFLLARVNPSQTKKNTQIQNVEGEVIATDDVSLEQFLDVLKNTVIMIDK